MTNDYSDKTDAELFFIMADASKAAGFAAEIGNEASECKYLDQVNDANTEINYRRREGSPLRPLKR